MALVSRFREEPRGLAWSVYKGHEVEMVWGWLFSRSNFTQRREGHWKQRKKGRKGFFGLFNVLKRRRKEEIREGDLCSQGWLGVSIFLFFCKREEQREERQRTSPSFLFFCLPGY